MPERLIWRTCMVTIAKPSSACVRATALTRSEGLDDRDNTACKVAVKNPNMSNVCMSHTYTLYKYGRGICENSDLHKCEGPTHGFRVRNLYALVALVLL